jgi:hypothetical protein
MKVSNYTKRVTLVCAAALTVVACAGQQLPAGAPPGATAARVGVGKQTWMLPEAKNEALLYVANVPNVTVYSYPQGKLVGTLTNFAQPSGACVDKAGDVYITDKSSQIFEYAHGQGKRIATFKDPLYFPRGCSVDPVTGNLAVANYEQTSNYPGDVAIYANAKGVPTSYIGFGFYYYDFCSYDSRGNLFIDGQNDTSFGFELGELHKGRRTIQAVSVEQQITAPGGVAWDGTHVAVGDLAGNAIYEFSVQANRATLIGTTRLSGSTGEVSQFGIDGSTVVVPVNSSKSSTGPVQFYNYPAGGSPTKSITNGVFFPIAAVISPAATP